MSQLHFSLVDEPKDDEQHLHIDAVKLAEIDLHCDPRRVVLEVVCHFASSSLLSSCEVLVLLDDHKLLFHFLYFVCTCFRCGFVAQFFQFVFQRFEFEARGASAG